MTGVGRRVPVAFPSTTTHRRRRLGALAPQCKENARWDRLDSVKGRPFVPLAGRGQRDTSSMTLISWPRSAAGGVQPIPAMRARRGEALEEAAGESHVRFPEPPPDAFGAIGMAAVPAIAAVRSEFGPTLPGDPRALVLR